MTSLSQFGGARWHGNKIGDRGDGKNSGSRADQIVRGSAVRPVNLQRRLEESGQRLFILTEDGESARAIDHSIY